MKKSNCEFCGAALLSKTRKRRFCNDQHKYLHRTGAPSSGLGSCAFCGGDFPWHGLKKWCSRDCKEWARRGHDPADIESLRASKKTIDVGLVEENARLVDRGIKRCTKCKDIKPLDQYAKSTTCAGGVESRCLACKAQDNKRWIASMDEARRAEHLRGRKERERRVTNEAAALRRIGRNAKRYLESVERRRKQRHKAAIAPWLEWCARNIESDEPTMAALAAWVAPSLGYKPWRLPSLTGAQAYRVRYAHDEVFALKERIRRQLKKRERRLDVHDKLRAALARGGRAPTVEAIVGYEISDLRDHLERQFTKGMNWDRFKSGEIHIDHIVPVKDFDLKDDAEVARCWAMPNLRPLWARDNLKKSAKRTHLI